MVVSRKYKVWGVCCCRVGRVSWELKSYVAGCRGFVTVG